MVWEIVNKLKNIYLVKSIREKKWRKKILLLKKLKGIRKIIDINWIGLCR